MYQELSACFIARTFCMLYCVFLVRENFTTQEGRYSQFLRGIKALVHRLHVYEDQCCLLLTSSSQEQLQEQEQECEFTHSVNL